MSKHAYYLIESGEALEMVKHHISEVIRVRTTAYQILQELGHEGGALTNIRSGVLSGIQARRGKQPEGFTVPNSKGHSYPKKGSAWAKRFAEQRGYSNAAFEFLTAFKVPTVMTYSNAEGCGSCGIGNISTQINPAAFLYLSEDGPYAVVIANIAFHVRAKEAEGYTVTGPAKAFDMTLPGCRRIEQEEWEILILQHELAERKAAEVPA